MIKTKTKIFNISSNNSNNGSYKSIVSVNLPNLNFNNDEITQVLLSVEHCEVPNSFYIINYTNNKLVINSITYNITVGNYNINTFITYLTAVLPSTIILTYSSISNKITITSSTTITINASQSTINKIIGLSPTDLSGSSSYVLPYVVNFLPIPRVNFKSNFFKFNNYSSTDNSSDLFLSLQNNTGQLNMINYINQTQTEFLIQDLTVSEFIINVTDDYNNLINFNGIDWTMTLLFKIDFVENIISNNFNSIIKTNINY